VLDTRSAGRAVCLALTSLIVLAGISASALASGGGE